ncbi:NmrA/HSCARG family protein [Curtobacterium sp. ME26]|uniref:NmrA/HSCARG family protein n=1 Tax=Curtobacterium sp. ME26 TaxID=2744254 RepID=UPI0015F5634C|nr:NmrA/HSCARG family protein [Curtobacterium sp. ME26]
MTDSSTTSTVPVAVFGATGNQGGAVVDALLQRGAAVRALVRRPESDAAKALAARGAELVHADASDAKSLVTALTGVDTFFFMTTFMNSSGEPATEADLEAEVAQGIALADAAVSAGVAHVVYSSVGGAERHSKVPHFDSKRRVEEHLEQLDVRVTFLRPAFFIDNFAYTGPSLENGELVLRMPLPDGIKLQMVATRDIGIVAAAALLGDPSVPSAIELAGDELTGSEIAAAFGQVAGLPARYEALPLQVFDGQEDMQAMFRWFAETPGYEASIDQVRTIDPQLLDLNSWLRSIKWAPADA